MSVSGAAREHDLTVTCRLDLVSGCRHLAEVNIYLGQFWRIRLKRIPTVYNEHVYTVAMQIFISTALCLEKNIPGNLAVI